jgi:hypothetical protein
MAYQSGKGIAFRPVGSSFHRGILNDRSDFEQMETKLDSLIQEIRIMKQSASYRMASDEFPALRTTATANQQENPRVPLPPRAPMTLCTTQGITFAFDPSVPPPLPRPDNHALSWTSFKRPGSQAINSFPPVVVGRPSFVVKSRPPGQLGASAAVAGPRGETNLIDRLFRYLQLSHHRRNWTNLPTSLNSRLNDFLRDINPPMMNDDLRGSLTDATNGYRGAIKMDVQKHLDDQIALLEEQLKASSPDDIERAAQSATSRLSQRLQNRFDGRRTREDVNKLIRIGCTINANNNINSINVPAASSVAIDIPALNSINVPSAVAITTILSASTSSSNANAENAVSDISMDVLESITLSPARASRLIPLTPRITLSNRFSILNEIDVSESIRKRSRVDRSPPADDISNANTQSVAVCISPLPLSQKTSICKTQIPTNKTSVSTIKITCMPCLTTLEEEDGAKMFGKKSIIENKHNINVKISEDTKILVIGDSNLRHIDIKQIDKSWHIICIPGANLELTTSIINAIPLTHQLTDIIITSGMCDRDNKTPHVQNCLAALDRLTVKKHFMGVSFDEKKCSRQQTINIKRINDTAKADVTTIFISPLKHVLMNLDGVHYKISTVRIILARLISHMKLFLCQTSPSSRRVSII